jgi:6-pyruvoyltetrahydropterin/6-carboxytetrahydropterin synthase
MFQVSVKQHFDAAHYLRGYGGKCEGMHGHRFQVVVSIQTRELDDIGIAFDFVELKSELNVILSRFDHTCLNEIPPFDKINPSSENIATTIYQQLQTRLGKVPISKVEVWESPESCVTYIP